MIHKQNHARHPSHPRRRVAISHQEKIRLQDFLTLTHAFYELALKCGFRGTFIVFLSDFQEVLKKIVRKDPQKFEPNYKSMMSMGFHRKGGENEKKEVRRLKPKIRWGPLISRKWTFYNSQTLEKGETV
jgi:hypothetical protein